MLSALDTLVIAGGKSTALEIEETARKLMPDLEITRFWGDVEERPTETLSESNLSDWLSRQTGKIGYILSMTHVPIRLGWLRRFEKAGLEPVNVIAPGVWISPSAKLGTGLYLAHGSVVSSGAEIRNHSMLNFQVVVGHDAVIGSHCALNPGASIGGGVKIGDGCVLGANSFVFQGKSIGERSKIDALTYVDRDIPPGSIVSSRGGRLRVLPQIGCSVKIPSTE